jgi:carbon starvation protein
VTLSIIVIATALWATWRAYRSGSDATSEDPAVPSRRFAPAGLFATKAEKRLEAEWSALPAEDRVTRSRH